MKRQHVFELTVFGIPAAIAVWLILLLAVFMLGAQVYSIVRIDPTHGVGLVMAPLWDGRQVPCVITRDTNALAIDCGWDEAHFPGLGRDLR